MNRMDRFNRWFWERPEVGLYVALALPPIGLLILIAIVKIQWALFGGPASP